ncbi:MAG TPA: GTPase [Burkholderiaceae bacterium]|nr:GTPase [Burkholderiaceae bacterium]
MTAETIALSLVSHTNVGKTTLARTLLRRDIGEVRDQAHVTQEAERHALIESAAGDQLELWDTPGLGDSVRLARRIEQAGNPVGWFLNQIWDRFRDRAAWSSQRALRNVLEQADAVLYLVNASESPEDVAYLDAELRVLALLQRPVIVLLNQMGPPRPAVLEAAEIERWRQRTASASCVRRVLAFDAFARCWVLEDSLLQAVSGALAEQRQAGFARLRDAWRQRGLETWRASMHVLAEQIARAALDREAMPGAGWTGRLKEIGAALGLRREGSLTPRELAMQALAERLDIDIRASTDRLIALHGLEGQAAGVVLTRLAEHYAVREPLSESKAAMLGGILTGALAGLKADIASGGLTMGGGLLAGGVLGALGAAGIARGYNLIRGVGEPTLAWAPVVLAELARSALLRYLAVAHYGRGRGKWSESEHPGFWGDMAGSVIERTGAELERAWKEGKPDALVAALEAWLTHATAILLTELYPDSRQLLEPGPALRSEAD